MNREDLLRQVEILERLSFTSEAVRAAPGKKQNKPE